MHHEVEVILLTYLFLLVNMLLQLNTLQFLRSQSAHVVALALTSRLNLSRTTTPLEFPHRRIDPLDPRSYPQGGSKFTQSQIYYIKLTLWPCIRFHLDFNPRWFLTYNLTYLRSSSFRLDLGPKNGPKLGQKCQKFKIFKKDRNVKCLVFQLII